MKYVQPLTLTYATKTNLKFKKKSWFTLNKKNTMQFRKHRQLEFFFKTVETIYIYLYKMVSE